MWTFHFVLNATFSIVFERIVCSYWLSSCNSELTLRAFKMSKFKNLKQSGWADGVQWFTVSIYMSWVVASDSDYMHWLQDSIPRLCAKFGDLGPHFDKISSWSTWSCEVIEVWTKSLSRCYTRGVQQADSEHQISIVTFLFLLKLKCNYFRQLL